MEKKSPPLGTKGGVVGDCRDRMLSVAPSEAVQGTTGASFPLCYSEESYNFEAVPVCSKLNTRWKPETRNQKLENRHRKIEGRKGKVPTLPRIGLSKPIHKDEHTRTRKKRNCHALKQVFST